MWKRIQPRSEFTIGAAIVVWLMVFAGCQTPKGRARQVERDDRIHKLVEWYQVNEQFRPANLDDNWNLIEQHRLQHVQQLDATKLLIKETQLEDQRRWLEQTPERHEAIRNVFSGRPESIEYFWQSIGP